MLPGSCDSSPAGSSSSSPVHRLSALLTSISSLLAPHTNSLLAAPAYITSIRYFQHRVTTLLENSTQEGIPPRGAEVEGLEREWWNSEVVAAWYGPKIPQGMSKIQKKVPKGRELIKKNVNTQGEQQHGKNNKRCSGKKNSDPLGAVIPIRRDASFVGLNDE